MTRERLESENSNLRSELAALRVNRDEWRAEALRLRAILADEVGAASHVPESHRNQIHARPAENRETVAVRETGQ